MNQTELKSLLKKYLEGSCSDEEKEQVQVWFDSISEPSLHLTDSEKNELQQTIRQNLPFHVSIGRVEKRKKIYSLMMQLGAAASIALLAIASWFMYSETDLIINEGGKLNSLSDAIAVSNSKTEKEVVILSDGSTVTLSPGSKIVFEKKFDAESREVQLTGEAFFEVVKDPERPFYVYSDNVTTKVLGTSFTVKTVGERNAIEVEVKTGCVSVYNDGKSKSDSSRKSGNKGVILTPNQKVVYFIKEDHWVTSVVEEPKPLPDLASDELVFDNTSMNEIVDELEERYGIEIIYEHPQISKCTFTGDVSALTLFDILNVIVKSISAEYEVRGARILITGKGCP